MLRYRLVVGIRYQELSKKLQLDPHLTLEKTKKTIRQKKLLENNTTYCKEMILRSLLWKKSDMESSTGSHPDQIRPQYVQRDNNSKCMNRLDNSLCTRCGCSKHYRGEMWPASSARCQRCVTRGHYIAQCFSRKVFASTIVCLY